jgi:hypothetical protein
MESLHHTIPKWKGLLVFLPVAVSRVCPGSPRCLFAEPRAERGGGGRPSDAERSDAERGRAPPALRGLRTLTTAGRAT